MSAPHAAGVGEATSLDLTGVRIQDERAAGALDEAAIAELRAGLRGALRRPGDEGYDAARRVWNGMVDRSPALIVRCAGAADVIHAVDFARARKLLVSVRGGGHNVTGNAVCEGGLMIDLSAMKGIRVNPLRRTARAEPGLTWGEFDRETQAFGLATTGGQITSTGIAGLTLGGGIGWLMRRCGLTVDNLLSVDIVTADGRLLTASATENPELFWGVRGGGGNFGIVTSFEYRLHPIGPIVTGGMVLYPAAQAKEVLHFFREYVTAAPDELMCNAVLLTAPPAPFIPEQLQGTQMVALAVCHTGPLEEGERAIEPLRRFGPPVVDLIGPMPYLAVQQLFDAAAPFGFQVYLKSDHLAALGDEVIDTVIAHTAGVTSPLSVVLLFPLGGAVARVAEQETAFAHRDAAFDYVIYSLWTDPAESPRHIQWTRDFAAAMQPYSVGVYVNELGNEGEDRVRAAYTPAVYERLVALKDKYDPSNFFRLNQNIRPTMERNKEIVRRFVEEAQSRGNLAAVDEYLAADFVDHTPFPEQPPTREGVRYVFGLLRTAFPDLYVTIEDQVAEGDRVVTRKTFHGTHQGDFLGIPPTGKRVSFGVTDILRIREGKLTDHWGSWSGSACCSS